MKLPTGENIHKELIHLSDEQVQHEYDLCYEILHGVYVDGEMLIEGMIYIDPDMHANSEQFVIALNTWTRRLEIAKTELLERTFLLS